MTKQKAFTKEFEREAVRLAQTSGQTRRQTAENLGVGLSTLTRWLSRSRDCEIDAPDPALKKRIGGLKATRDQAQVDAERAAATLESSGQAITPAMLRKFARTARERMRIDGGGYRRDHLRALAKRVEVADGEVRIMGSKGDLLRTRAAASSVKSAAVGVRSSVLKWRMGWDSNPRDPCEPAGFQDRCLQPLGHPSGSADHSQAPPNDKVDGRRRLSRR